MKKLTISIIIVVLLTALLSLSAITALAADEPVTINSIEIEAPKPSAGATADLSDVKIKSANGDEALAELVGFISKNLYWAKVPSLDPSDWGSDWTKFTGTFEAGEIYSLHFALQSEVALASNCAVTVSTPDGEVWWSGNIASQDATYVVGDAVIELEAFVINSIELNTSFPFYYELPTIKSVNGNEEYKDYVTLSTIFESAWYAAEDPGTAIDDPNSLHWDKIDGSIDEEENLWLDLQTHFMVQGGATFAENCEVTLNVFEREIASTELKSEATLNYADIYLIPIEIDMNDGTGQSFYDCVAFGEDYTMDFNENPIPKPGFCGVAFTPDATDGEMQITIPSVKQSYTLYACYGEVITTITSIEITSTVEIAPVTGGEVIWDDEAFTVSKINGKDAPYGIFDRFNIYWLFSDTFGYNDNYIDFEEDTFRGGFYYCLNIDVYLFVPYAETVEITLKTPTQTYVADVFSGEAYAYAYFSFDKTESEGLKKYGDTVVTMDGFEVGARADDITVSVIGEGIDFVGEYLEGYAILDIEADDYLSENDVIEAGKLYALELCLLGKEGYCIIDFSQSYDNVTLNGSSPDIAYYDKNYEDEDYVSVSFTLPMLGDGLMKVTAPTMSMNGYELGCDIYDILINFESEGLFVYPEYDEDYWAWEMSGNGDDTVNYCESFEFVLYMWLNDGYTSDGITKDMFILNGIEPAAIYNKAVHFGDGTIEPCVIAWYKLPVFHEYTNEWYNDSTNHWNECVCEDKANLAPHADVNNDDKCDSCGYDMLSNSNDPSNPDKKDGLGAGAIVGIVAGAIVLLGGGGFAIFWFVIEKKSAADLLALVKSNTTAHSEATSKEETPAEEKSEESTEETNEE